MDETKEREIIQTECMRLNRYLSYVRRPSAATGADNMTRLTFQLGQAIVFCKFISMISENYFSLIRGEEKADEIGINGLKQLHGFLEEYTALLIEEYKQMDDQETNFSS